MLQSDKARERSCGQSSATVNSPATVPVSRAQAFRSTYRARQFCKAAAASIRRTNPRLRNKGPNKIAGRTSRVLSRSSSKKTAPEECQASDVSEEEIAQPAVPGIFARK